MNDITYNFIVPRSSGYSLEQLINWTFDKDPLLYSRGTFTWGHQSFLLLKRLGMPVSLSFDMDPSAINLAHGNTLRELEGRADCFCVSLQADYPHYPLAQYHIVQNRDQCARNAAFVPHWPQPGQVPRNADRTGVQRVAYQGNGQFTVLNEKRLNADLNPHGITFEILGKNRWADLQEVDLLLGVRSFGRKRFKRKPPTKLIDAWHAGIPFIGGWDSAYEQIGLPGKEYLRVSTYADLLQAILDLKNSPEAYSQLVQAGRGKVVSYTPEIIATEWQALLEGKVLESYVKWKESSSQVLKYHIRKLGYDSCMSMRQGIHLCYKFSPIKILRDRYYDPVK